MAKKENESISTKNSFYVVNLEIGQNFQKKNIDADNLLLFFLSGEVEAIYNGSRPYLISAGNMIFLTRLADCVLTPVRPVKVLVFIFDDWTNVCDKYIFQTLMSISSLLKYEFKELPIRHPVTIFLDLFLVYLEDKVPLYKEKQKELFILLRAYYSKEELAMLFYPLIGKNVDFKNTVLNMYPRAKSVTEFADLCGYSSVVFQRKFKDIFGETVYQWMQRQKAEHIKHRLMTEEVNLKDLTDEFEFASPAHLNKFCKIWFGMNPSELRQTLLLKKNLK